ncbi:MAG: hypothetical protein U0835_03000 [Isosphaeraceae bacterium]
MRARIHVAASLLACSLGSCGRPAIPPIPAAAGLTPPPPQVVPETRPADPDPSFADVAAAAGVKTVLYCGGPDKDHILESVGTGAALVDYGGDGRLDVYLVNAWAARREPFARADQGPQRPVPQPRRRHV